MPSDESAPSFYADDYVSSNVSPDVNTLNADEACFVDAIAAHAPAGSILEVGCYDGRLLSAFQRKGWDVDGCELSNAAEVAEILIQKPVSREAFSAELFSGSLFDVIYCRYVLEHIGDPVAFLKSMARLLREDGFIVVEVPDAGQRLSDGVLGVFAHEHMGYYTAMSLCRVFHAAGIKPFLERTGPQGLTLFGALLDRPWETQQPEDLQASRLIDRWMTLRNLKKDALLDIIKGLGLPEPLNILVVGADSHTYDLLNDSWPEVANCIIIADDDPRKRGKFFVGTDIVVMSLDQGMATRPAAVVVSTYASSFKIAERIISVYGSAIPVITLYPEVRAVNIP